jgi:aminodeoxyfutalosine synthase
MALSELEERHPGFLAFVSLAFHPENTGIKFEDMHGTTGRDDLVTIAAARLILHNIPHIKSYWIMLGEKIAQTALWFGSDDLEGTVIDEKITHAAGASSPKGLPKERILRIIRSAGRVPVERDAFYNEVKRYE